MKIPQTQQSHFEMDLSVESYDLSIFISQWHNARFLYLKKIPDKRSNML